MKVQAVLSLEVGGRLVVPALQRPLEALAHGEVSGRAIVEF